ncbi:hypothetical protein ABIE76_006407 [Sinorhizobium fredii]
MNLKDPSLFRQAALVGENWIEADPQNAIEVNNPATGEIIGRVTETRRRRDQGCDRNRGARTEGMGGEDGQGALGGPAPLV